MSSPVVEVNSSVSSNKNITKTIESAAMLVLTGKVNVIRDEASYKVKEVDLIAEDGRIYRVSPAGCGKQLVKVLRSKIVRVAGELKANGSNDVLVVHDSEIIGSTKKTEAKADIVASSGSNSVPPAVSNLKSSDATSLQGMEMDAGR